MSNKGSVLSAITAAKSEAEVQSNQGRTLVSKVGTAPLTAPKKRAKEKMKEGHSMYPIRNLPDANREDFKLIKEAGLFRESFNQFMLDAVQEKLNRMKKKMDKEVSNAKA
jgi:guanyl-specific ribonuclease Sa